MSLVRFRLTMLIPILSVFAATARASDRDSLRRIEVFGGDSLRTSGPLISPSNLTLLDARTLALSALDITRAHSISASFEIPNEAVSLPNVGFTRSENRFGQSVKADIDLHSNPNLLGLRRAVEADHVSAAHEAGDADLLALGLHNPHAGHQWNFPVTIGAVYRF